MSDKSSPSIRYDIYAHHGHNLIKSNLERHRRDHGVLDKVTDAVFPPSPFHSAEPPPNPVGILGAGVYCSTSINHQY
jgi:hypothetical protein